VTKGLTGSLKGLGVAEALSSIAAQQRTGVLQVSGPSSSVMVHFAEGMVVRVDEGDRSAEQALVDVLVGSEVAAPPAVQSALERHAQSGKSLVEALAAEGAASGADAAALLLVVVTDTFARMFEWSSGKFSFQDGAEHVRPLVAPLDTEALLSDGVRIAEEWPVVRGRVADGQGCFTRRRPLEGGEHEAGLGPNEMLVYTLVREDRTVRQLEALSRLGRFETRRALYQLLELGYVSSMAITARGQEEVRAKKTDRATRRRQMVHALINLFLILLLVALAMAVARRHLAETQQQVLGHLEGPDSGLRALLGEHQEARIRTALEVYWLHRGAYPSDLGQLVEAQLLRESDLRFPFFEEPYFYERRGERLFELVRPLR